MDSFHWLGQPYEDWPRWLQFRNWGRLGDRLTITQLEGDLVLELGDRLDKRADNFLTVRKSND